MKPNNKRLENIAQKLRYRTVTMIGPDKSGHFGGSMSVADIVSVLYFHQMNCDPKDAKSKTRDRLIFSK